MDSEFENKPQEQSSESKETREGYAPAGGYQKSYRPVGRPQRPRINSHRSYGSDRSSSNTEGGFRPEGFGAGLASSNSERPQRSGYQSRGGYNNNRGGYGRPQQGGYGRPQQGGYGRPQQGGYGRPQQGGYNNNRGGYGRPQQGGYNNNRGSYGRPQQGGYNNNRGGYGNNRNGGYRQHTPGYDPNAKYSLKKRIEYKEENIDPNEPLRLNKFLANASSRLVW